MMGRYSGGLGEGLDYTLQAAEEKGAQLLEPPPSLCLKIQPTHKQQPTPSRRDAAESFHAVTQRTAHAAGQVLFVKQHAEYGVLSARNSSKVGILRSGRSGGGDQEQQRLSAHASSLAASYY